jgi:WD40 repeat protein
MSSRDLHDRPNLQQYKKQAKALLRQYKAGDAAALSRFREHHPARSTTAARRTVRLSDAQCVLAREHGFDSWPKFVKHVEAASGREPDQSTVVRAIQLHVPTHAEVNLGVFLVDGERMLTATEAEPVRLWDLAGGTCLREFAGFSNHAWALKPATDQRSVAMGCRDGAVRVVDLEDGRVRKTLIGHRGIVRCIDASADLGLVISGGMQDQTLRVWDTASERCAAILEGHRGGIYSVALDREGRRALSGSRDGTMRLWDLERGQCAHVFDAHAYHVHGVAWAADGRRALSCSQEIRLWDLENGTCVRTFEGHTATIRSVSWGANQRLALSAAHDCTVRVWDVETGGCRHVFAGHSTGAINAVWASGGRILSCDWNGEVRTWRMPE